MLERDGIDGPFPEELIEMIREVVEQEDQEPIEIEITPQSLDRVSVFVDYVFSENLIFGLRPSLLGLLLSNLDKKGVNPE